MHARTLWVIQRRHQHTQACGMPPCRTAAFDCAAKKQPGASIGREPQCKLQQRADVQLRCAGSAISTPISSRRLTRRGSAASRGAMPVSTDESIVCAASLSARSMTEIGRRMSASERVRSEAPGPTVSTKAAYPICFVESNRTTFPIDERLHTFGQPLRVHRLKLRNSVAKRVAIRDNGESKHLGPIISLHKIYCLHASLCL